MRLTGEITPTGLLQRRGGQFYVYIILCLCLYYFIIIYLFYFILFIFYYGRRAPRVSVSVAHMSCVLTHELHLCVVLLMLGGRDVYVLG